MKTLKYLVLGTLILIVSTAVRSQDIFDALEKNDLAQIKALIEANSQLVMVKDETGDTPLHHAAWQKQPEMILYLISKGADVNIKDANLRTPLHLSTNAGSIECTRILIEKGADVKVADFREQMPLHYAAQNGLREIAEMLISAGSPLDAKNSYGRTPLLLCCRERGTPELARLLIDAGSDVNAKDNFGSTPLELAAWRGYKGIISLLIEKGADIPTEGETAYAIFNSACQQGLAELFSKQVEKGIEIPLSDNQKGTLLHDAAKGGSPEIIKVLIEKGLIAGSKDKYGWAPLHYAALNNRTEAIEMLLMKGADINARTIMGQSAYNVAEEYGRVQAKDMLAGKGADVSPVMFPKLEGQYLGQNQPDSIPVIFAVGIISSVWGLHSSLAFSPDGNEVYWSPMIEIPGQTYSEGGIWYMKRINNRWTPPEPAAFSVNFGGNNGEPFFSPDGKRLYFNSDRPNPLQRNQEKENIWYVERAANGWSEPAPIDQVINRMNMHWQFSVDRKGNIYFASDNAGGFGMQDIYCSKLINGAYQKPENLGERINTDKGDMTPYISPDGDYLIYCRGLELYISYKEKDGNWSEAKSLGSPVNTGFELCPIVTPDGEFLIFLSGREGESHPFWVSVKIIEELEPDTSQK
jgi:ankyrin repeat protein